MLAQIATPDVDVAILLPLLFMAVGGLLVLTMASVTKSLPAWFFTAWAVGAASLLVLPSLLVLITKDRDPLAALDFDPDDDPDLVAGGV